MTLREGTLLCWHAENAGIEVLEQAIKSLREKKIDISKVLYLVQSDSESARKIPFRVADTAIEIETNAIELRDPTNHADIYAQVRQLVLPKLLDVSNELHLNISPGTPAMHSVWLILHAGGSFPEGTQIWSSQYNKKTKRARLNPVEFSISTYLSEIRRGARLEPIVATYEPEAYSDTRRLALDRLARYARLTDAPLLILGERGIGKTRLVESYVSKLKGDKKVVSVACGGLDSTLIESQLFGHRKGAYTGASTDRPGLLKEASGGILFLDEIQDLPKQAQRQLVRVLQDRHRHFRAVGSDREETADFELVCASNLSFTALEQQLDSDLFDRLSHLLVTLPPLRDCRKDIRDDWQRVWQQECHREELPVEAPWSKEIQKALGTHQMPGNLRDLQRLALLCAAWWSPFDTAKGITIALEEWQARQSRNVVEASEFIEGSREMNLSAFKVRFASWAKKRYGTLQKAAEALDCDVTTLRRDAACKSDKK